MNVQVQYEKYGRVIGENEEAFEQLFAKKLSAFMNRISGFRPVSFTRDVLHKKYKNDDVLVLHTYEQFGEQAADLIRKLLQS